MNDHGPIIHKDELRGAMDDATRAAFEKFDEANRSGQGEKTVKLFGMFPMSASFAGLISGFYNEGAAKVGAIVAPKAHEISASLLSKHTNLKGANLARTSTVAAVSANLALSGAAYFNPLVQSFRGHRQTYKDLARSIAPVLEDIRGDHSVGALMSIKAEDNEMVFAHRKGLATKMNVENTNNVISLLMNAGPAIFETQDVKGMWKGEHLPASLQSHAAMTANNAKPQSEQSKDLVNWALTTFRVGRGSIATYIMAQNERKLDKIRRPYSALDMVMELDKQVSADPQARSYTMPHGRESYRLDEYIAQIMRAHQKDMADISDKHTEIREALSEDVMKVSHKLAEAIRHGEMSTLSLVRLIGEGKIIKKQGRAIASLAEVKQLIENASIKQSTYVNVDPADYYKDASFTQAQLKTALKGLEGDERTTFAAMFPDSVLEEAGMSTKDIKAMRAATAKQYDTLLAEAIIGLNAKSDDALKAMGLAENEIKHVRDSHEHLAELGLPAIKEMKSSATNDRGVEHVVANAVVHDVTLFGPLVKEGQAKIGSLPTPEAADRADEMADASLARIGRSARENPSKYGLSHADRALSRREEGSETEIGY